MMNVSHKNISNQYFESVLKRKGLSKKAFAEYAGIPYFTVAGWKKKGEVPTYAMVILNQMPTHKKSVTAADLIKAGLPRAVLWNNQSDKEVPVDIFIVSTLQKAYNDFVIDKLTEYFGKESVLTALLKYKDRISERLINQVTKYLQELPRSA
ncbi:hypothetical protein [Hydrogenimonas sp. SS33]|uniref:hypothetical protein n=1 Tax=Hydrogenimonas leucolamina TaxID=2954236 RepID=UPI00336BE0E6